MKSSNSKGNESIHVSPGSFIELVAFFQKRDCDLNVFVSSKHHQEEDSLETYLTCTDYISIEL